MAYASRQATITIGPATDEVQFIVYSSDPNVTRGVGFNLTIQAQNKADLTLKTDYTPTSTVSLTIDSGSDSLSQTSIDNTGWTSGAKTISSLSITGGSGGTAATITAQDDTLSLANGTYDIVLDGTETTKSYGNWKYYEGLATGYDLGTADADGGALWTTLLSDTSVAYRGDTSLASWSPIAGNPGLVNPKAAGWSFYDVSSYIDTDGGQHGYRATYTISAGDRASAIAARIKLDVLADVASDAQLFRLDMYFSESSSEFASGAALEDMASPHVSKNLNTLATHGSTAYVEIPISVLDAMSGSTLYVWANVKKLSDPAWDSSYYNANLDFTCVDAATNGLVIYK